MSRPIAPTSTPPPLPSNPPPLPGKNPTAGVPSADEQATLQTVLTRIGADANTIVARQQGGSLAPQPALPGSADEAMMAALPPLPVGGPQGSTATKPPDFRLRRTLGEGGMGVVRLAEQRSLVREVAIKSVRPTARGAGAALALLREAWVLGQLEHPNVVPIHALGQDPDGAPTFVMKRVEGEVWSHFIHDPSKLPEAAQGDPLRWHLGVLQQVCNAVAFAHSKGILHRDLKPENVMIGRFGEVYVLDWGLAVSLDQTQAQIPLARDVHDIAGTLQYMAPEMVAGQGAQLDARTDVYLLGAMLHEVLTGQARHAGVTPMEILAAAWHSRSFAYDSDVPEELAAIANRATAFSQAQRFADVPSLQAALTSFLEHRSSLTATMSAESQLAQLKALLATDDAETTPPEAASAGDPATPANAADAIATTFAACRFGFQMALDLWPDNSRAATGLEAALRMMIAYEVRADNPGGARPLLSALTTPAPALEREIEALEQRHRQAHVRAAQLDDLEQDLNERIGSRTRAFLALLMGLVFGGLPVLHAVRSARGEAISAYRYNLGAAAAFLALCVGAGIWARDTLSKTLFNRRVALSVLAIAVGNLALTGAVWQLGLAPEVAPQLSMVLNGLATALVAANLDGRLWRIPLVYTLAFVGMLVHPRWLYLWAALGYGGALLIAAWFWRPGAIRGTYDGDARAL